MSPSTSALFAGKTVFLHDNCRVNLSTDQLTYRVNLTETLLTLLAATNQLSFDIYVMRNVDQVPWSRKRNTRADVKYV